MIPFLALKALVAGFTWDESAEMVWSRRLLMCGAVQIIPLPILSYAAYLFCLGEYSLPSLRFNFCEPAPILTDNKRRNVLYMRIVVFLF